MMELKRGELIETSDLEPSLLHHGCRWISARSCAESAPSTYPHTYTNMALSQTSHPCYWAAHFTTRARTLLQRSCKRLGVLQPVRSAYADYFCLKHGSHSPSCLSRGMPPEAEKPKKTKNVSHKAPVWSEEEQEHKTGGHTLTESSVASGVNTPLNSRLE